jgi:hypothetical protein
MEKEEKGVDGIERYRKLPPLNIRPFQPEDRPQVNQLIADSTYRLPFF